MKLITIKVDSEEENEKIEYFVKEFIKLNFINYKKAEIKIEDENTGN